jgi:cytochrome c-type biogenesis protein CcmH/NrfG
MSARIPKQNKGDSRPPRSKMSVLTIAFAIAMAFFLVIGAVAVGITEFIGGDDPQQPAQQDFDQSLEEEGEDEEQELRDRIEEDPKDYSAHGQLAVLLGNTGRVVESIDHYERALQDDPEDVSLRMSFARTLNQGGYDLDAEIQLERVLEEDGENVEAMFLLGEIMQRSDPPRQDEADDLFERVVETEPDSFYAERAQEYLATEDNADEDADTEAEPGAGDDEETD